MKLLTLASLRKPAVSKLFPLAHKPENNEQGKLWLQTRSRDNIIKKLAAACPYAEGEVVTPHSQEERDKWGTEIVVEKICDSYAKYGKGTDWPKDNSEPLIVTAYNKAKAARFFCTVGYLIPLNQDGSIPKDKK